MTKLAVPDNITGSLEWYWDDSDSDAIRRARALPDRPEELQRVAGLPAGLIQPSMWRESSVGGSAPTFVDSTTDLSIVPPRREIRDVEKWGARSLARLDDVLAEYHTEPDCGVSYWLIQVLGALPEGRGRLELQDELREQPFLADSDAHVVLKTG